LLSLGASARQPNAGGELQAWDETVGDFRARAQKQGCAFTYEGAEVIFLAILKTAMEYLEEGLHRH
jgi:hypothetical protein